MSPRCKIQRGVLALGVLAMLLAGPVAAAALPRLPEPSGPAVGPEGAVVRVHLSSREDVPVLASLGVDIWKVEREQMLLIGAVGSDLYDQLLARGFVVEVDAERTQELLVPPGYPCYRTVEEVLNHMLVVSDTYPQLTELVDYGDSWEKVQDPNSGYDILAMRITNEAIAGPKPVLLIVSTHHARETVVPEIADFYIDYLTGGFRGQGGYGIDPDVTWLVDHREIWIVPLVNPDGRKMIEPSGWWWRKNTNDTINPGCAWPPTASNHYGVDINRNYDYMWGYDDQGSSPDPCAQGYRGVSPVSEPETQAIQLMGDDLFPNPADPTGMMLTLHSAVPALLIPWGYNAPAPAPDDAALRVIACKWAVASGYPVGRPGEILWYSPNGTTDDWFYGDRDVASFTFEIGDDFFEPCWGNDFPWNLWEENLPALVHAAKVVAPDPYQTSYGPDAHTLAVSPDPVPAGTPVTLTATIEDIRLLNSYCTLAEQPVAQAEFFVDAPGSDGSGLAMVPIDGSWDEIAEEASAMVDTSSLAPGTHYLLVHGRSSAGQWGPFTAVFLTVEPGQPCEPVTISEVLTHTEGCTVTFGAVLTGTTPYTYSWDFGPLGTSDQPTPTVGFGSSGTYPYTLTVSNCGGTGQDSLSGTVTVSCAPPCTAVEILEVMTQTAGCTVTFGAALTGTTPFTYSWDLGSYGTFDRPTLTVGFGVSGIYPYTLTVTNCGGAGWDSFSGTVAVSCAPPPYRIYLPLVRRGA